MSSRLQDWVEFSGESCSDAFGLVGWTVVVVLLLPFLLLIGMIYAAVKALLSFILEILYALGIWEPNEENPEQPNVRDS